MPNYDHHVFICTNERGPDASRPSCGHEKSKAFKGLLKDAAKKAGLKGRVRVQETGCLDQCEHAPVVVVYPEAVWYGFVGKKDLVEIVEQHLVGGKPVERLRLPESCINNEHCPHREKK
ncbi:ferredoxin [Granulicella cerasi]|uniref:Ferredoxin n=1 Tax=Granulicella cerasi TaxID=741063 RepID=A0ABW1Z5G5_9BACT|nr:(2Fe-2S) ferredoxin domain-containing protein [Granulicella cerasi]